MSERAIVKQILFFLTNQHDCWAFKTVGGPMQRRGVPDLIGCCRGEFFGLEVKRPGEGASPSQCVEIGRITQAGGKACVVTCVEQVKAIVSAIRETKKISENSPSNSSRRGL